MSSSTDNSIKVEPMEGAKKITGLCSAARWNDERVQIALRDIFTVADYEEIKLVRFGPDGLQAWFEYKA